MNSKRKIPNFKSEKQERAFWENPENNSGDYLDLSKMQRAVLPNLKPSTASISLRLPQGLLNDIKVLANRMDVPYQSLMKTWLNEKAADARR